MFLLGFYIHYGVTEFFPAINHTENQYTTLKTGSLYYYTSPGTCPSHFTFLSYDILKILIIVNQTFIILIQELNFCTCVYYFLFMYLQVLPVIKETFNSNLFLEFLVYAFLERLSDRCDRVLILSFVGFKQNYHK